MERAQGGTPLYTPPDLAVGRPGRIPGDLQPCPGPAGASGGLPEPMVAIPTHPARVVGPGQVGCLTGPQAAAPTAYHPGRERRPLISQLPGPIFGSGDSRSGFHR